MIEYDAERINHGVGYQYKLGKSKFGIDGREVFVGYFDFLRESKDKIR
ncbi:MAG: hypothetical protein AAF960_26640 [Bacteroidota bacterium]